MKNASNGSTLTLADSLGLCVSALSRNFDGEVVRDICRNLGRFLERRPTPEDLARATQVGVLKARMALTEAMKDLPDQETQPNFKTLAAWAEKCAPEGTAEGLMKEDSLVDLAHADLELREFWNVAKGLCRCDTSEATDRFLEGLYNAAMEEEHPTFRRQKLTLLFRAITEQIAAQTLFLSGRHPKIIHLESLLAALECPPPEFAVALLGYRKGAFFSATAEDLLEFHDGATVQAILELMKRAFPLLGLDFAESTLTDLLRNIPLNAAGELKGLLPPNAALDFLSNCMTELLNLDDHAFGGPSAGHGAVSLLDEMFRQMERHQGTDLELDWSEFLGTLRGMKLVGEDVRQYSAARLGKVLLERTLDLCRKEKVEIPAYLKRQVRLLDVVTLCVQYGRGNFLWDEDAIAYIMEDDE